MGTPGVIWHRKVPPSGLWLCGSASTWQWRAQDTTTLHATPPRTVLHAPTPTITLVRRHDVYAAAMSTGGATMVSSRHVDTSGLSGYWSASRTFVFSYFQNLPQDSIRESPCLPVDYVLMHRCWGWQPETARSSTIRREDSDGLMSFVGNPRPFRSRAHGFIFSGLKRRKCCPIFGPRNEFPVNSKDVSVSVSSAFLWHFTSYDSRRNLRQALRDHLLKTVSTMLIFFSLPARPAIRSDCGPGGPCAVSGSRSSNRFCRCQG